jgi:ribosome-binding protein aMBF1 (putative translation factor)
MPPKAVRLRIILVPRSEVAYNHAMESKNKGPARRKSRLKKAGWKVGSTAEFLKLSPEEELYVEFKVGLSRCLKKQRQKNRLTQEQLARRIKSSQSRIAKMEKADPSVSIDLLVRSLLALGTPRREIVKAIA